MVLPPRLRYGLVRLQALNRPLLWGVGVGAVLLVVVVRQYGAHPEWFSPFEMSSRSPAQPNPGTDLAQLSAEELAGLAEIDNLTLLLNQMQPTTSTLTPATASSPIASLLPPLTGQGESAANPLQAYLDRLQFQGGGPQSALPWSSADAGQADPRTTNADPRARPSLLPPPAPAGAASGRAPLATTETPALAPSPLQQALNQRMANRDSRPNEATSRQETPADQNPNVAPSGLTPPPWMVEGYIPGVSQRFIRTTPEMSPLPGTTGYTRPPTLPPVVDSSASLPGQVPTPAPLDLNFRPAVPTSGPGVEARPGVASPTLSPSSGLSDRPPLAQPEAAPFSVPRPPGSYIGGGYIHTFSDPNGPVD